jgi:excisionase family DNA binding protein
MNKLQELMMFASNANDVEIANAIDCLKGRPKAKSESEGPKLMNLGNAAKYLSVSRATLYRMIESGKIDPVNLYENTKRIRKADLDAIIEGWGV